jgi:hypothetical protein
MSDRDRAAWTAFVEAMEPTAIAQIAPKEAERE